MDPTNSADETLPAHLERAPDGASQPTLATGNLLQRPVIVVGGGVVGAACAYYLSQAGCDVVLIDRTEFGMGCSHANCGYVSPSHVLPLCKPGAISQTLKTVFQRNSPFKLRPRLDIPMWSWLLQFAGHCNQRDMMQAAEARHALLQSSRALYQDLMDRGTLEDCEWQTLGLLFVHQSQEHFEHNAETDALLREHFHLGAQRLDAEALLKLEPALKPVVAGAWKYDCDAHLRPDKLMEALHGLLLEQGVVIRENCELIDFDHGDGSVSAIQTSLGRLEIDQVVVCTGAWTRLLKKLLRNRIPIEPGKGYSITMERPETCPRYPMIFEDHRVAITPMQSGYRIGSTMEFAGFDRTLRQERLNLLINGAKIYLKDPIREPFQEQWYGWRPMSSDGIPLIGKLPKFDNVWMAAGHSMLGLSMATGTGRLIAELISGKVPHIDPHPYRPGRF